MNQASASMGGGVAAEEAPRSVIEGHALVPSVVFPLIRLEHQRGRSYLDNGATTQKPEEVIEAEARFYRERNANIHRGIHRLSMEATDHFEAVRAAAARFIGGARPEEIIFCRGATEALNLAAHSWGLPHLQPGDEVVLTTLEHHSNLVPWQLVAARGGARLVELKPDREGAISEEALARAIGPRTRLVGMTHVSNLLGSVNDIRMAAEAAHRAGALLLVDGAQAVGHMPVDVGELGCDLYAVSGHKMFGPTGTGFLWGRYELLERFEPFLGGGDMIEEVWFEQSTWAGLPARLEAGTPNIGGVAGLGAAIEFLERVGMTRVRRHDMALAGEARERLAAIPGVTVYGPSEPRLRSGLVSFNVEGIHAHDVGCVLDAEGVAVRTGHMCSQPALRHLGIESCVRASFALYNSREDLRRLTAGLEKTVDFFNAR
jgi:cysteine desulfurase/selenocysteine lyase